MTKQRFITLSELCELLQIGKQTYYKLVRRGAFPAPMRAGTRPVFDQELAQQCVEVVRSRVGINGEPVLLNARMRPSRPTTAPAPKKKATEKHEDLLAALASLGVQTTAAKVQAVLETLPPDLPEGELIKAVFRELKKQS